MLHSEKKALTGIKVCVFVCVALKWVLRLSSKMMQSSLLSFPHDQHSLSKMISGWELNKKTYPIPTPE